MSDVNNFIDSVISEAAQEVPAKAEPKTPSVNENQDLEGVNQQENEVNEQDESEEIDQSDDVDQALDKLKKSNKKKLNYIRNLREREKNLLSEIEKLKSSKIEVKALNPDEFDGTYGEYIKQTTLEEMRAELSQSQQKMQLSQLEAQQQVIEQERAKVVREEAVYFASQSQDFAKVISANTEKLDLLPEEVQNLFFELENPTLAVYALAKENKIELLTFMSPYMAAVEIAKAQDRGQKYLQETGKKQVSNAPAPIQGLKGASKPAPSRLSEKSPDDLYKWIKS